MAGDGRRDIIDAGPRRRRVGWIAVVALLALIGVPVIGLLTGREKEPEPQPPSSSSSVPAPRSQPTLNRVDVRPNVLIPDTRKDGDRRVLDVTFPDGTRARLSYPARLKLAELGVRPAVGVRPGKSGELRRLYAPLLGEVEISGGEPMLRRLTGTVGLWPQRAGRLGGGGYVMVFTFGRWSMAMGDDYAPELTFEQRMELALGVRGKVDRAGFLVLTAGETASIGRPGELAGGATLGPQLWFGGGMDPVVVLARTPGCGPRSVLPRVVSGRGYAERSCRGDILVAAGGDRDFVRRIVRDLRVDPLPPRGR
ncbi:hypothetical protein [Streptosporangium sp. KLBMP 9127]|nr:hypothetical protein [Streptosporangium sp. KLBMP 9127]